jgi:L-arabinose isomerase
MSLRDESLDRGRKVAVRDPELKGAGFGDQLVQKLNLTGDPEDRIIVEIGREVDRFDELMEYMKPSMAAQAATRRVMALKKLYDVINDRKEREGKEGEVRVVATLVLKLKETLREQNFKTDQIETIVNTMIAKVSEETKRAERARNK